MTRRDARAPEGRRQDAIAIFRAALEAADPASAARRGVRMGRSGRPVIAGEELGPSARLRLLAVGKAALPMALGAVEALPPESLAGLASEPGLIVTHEVAPAEHPRAETSGSFIRALRSGHPLPDERGLEAAREVERLVSGARPGDGLLVLLSGGSSALLPAPAPRVSLPDKIGTTRLLLDCGAPIEEINVVRKHLSRLKGGQLAARAQPAAVEALLVSDVVGDDPATIGSGPTAPDPSTFAEARDALLRRGIWERVPPPARLRIEAGARGEIEETPKPGDPVFARVSNRVVASGPEALRAAARRAEELGYEARIVSEGLVGEARDAAARLARAAAEAMRGGPRALLAAGETTVTVRGLGRGGRNQELALAFALEMERLGAEGGWLLLSAGTDGRDGPTDAAGGLVDSGTLARARGRGCDPRAHLEDNDSHPILDASGDLLRTGATGTNVADVQLALLWGGGS